MREISNVKHGRKYNTFTVLLFQPFNYTNDYKIHHETFVFMMSRSGSILSYRHTGQGEMGLFPVKVRKHGCESTRSDGMGHSHFKHKMDLQNTS